MSYAARIQDGVVVEVTQLPAGLGLEEAFHPDAGFVEATSATVVGMLFDGAFHPAPAPEPRGEVEIRADLMAHAADRRWRIETGGILVAGVPVATDDRAKIMIMGARVAASADPAWSTVWHGSDGETYPLDAGAMIAVSNAVEAHVNATFATFATIRAGILAGTLTTTAAIDAAFEA
jgi:hypothetical protein